MIKIRHFGAFFEAQEKWLNKMALQGYKLIKTGIMTYYFDKCALGEYEYRIEFVGAKPHKEAMEYKLFLERLGYTVYIKNLQANYAIGKMKFRPWAKGSAKIATTAGGYNKEIFIIEKKKDGKSFEIHTSKKDLAEYYQPMRNMWLTSVLSWGVFTIILFGLSFIPALSDIKITFFILSGIFGLFFVFSCVPLFCYNKLLHKVNKEMKYSE